MDKFLRLISRVSVGGLVIFELLNQFGFLHFTLNFTWFGLAITSIVVWLMLEICSYFLKKKYGYCLAGWVLALAAAGLYVDALGDILRWYGKYGWYDQLAHVLGGAACGGIFFFIIYTFIRAGKIKLGLFGQGTFALFSASFLGVAYELEEYFEDYFTGSKRLGDGPDTANDLFLNIVGALSIILITSIYLHFKKYTVNKTKNKS
jgi:hypothetical protein